MKKEVLRKVMKRAHEIARKLVGDYIARLKMALKIAWAEIKTKGVRVMEGFKRIVLGEEIEYNGLEHMWGKEVYTGKVAIEKETEKAIYVVFRGVGKEYEIDEDDKVVGVVDEWDWSQGFWLPKSQIKVEENVVYVPEWLAKKNRIQFAQ